MSSLTFIFRELRTDTRFAFRSLRATPWFTALASAIIGMGLGSVIAAVSVTAAIYFTAPKIPDIDRVFYAIDRADRPRPLREVQDGVQHVVEESASFTRAAVFVASPSKGLRTQAEVVEAGYFDAVRPRMHLGRPLSAADENSLSGTAVVSMELWRSLFGENTNLVDAVVQVDDKRFAVVGVVAKEFRGLVEPWSRTDVWVLPSHYFGPIYKGLARRIVLRARSDASWDVIRRTLSSQFRADYQGTEGAQYALYRASDVIDPSRPEAGGGELGLLTLSSMAVTLLVLVISVVNVAGLFAARGLSRLQEVAVRLALGARSSQILRQHAFEGAALATIALPIAFAVAATLTRFAALASPVRLDIGALPDGRAVLIGAGLAVVCGAFIGISGAMQCLANLHRGSLAQNGAARTTRLRRRAVYGIALPQAIGSFALICAALVYAAALPRLTSTPYSGSTTQLVGRIEYRGTGGDTSGETTAAYYRLVLERLRAIPEITAVGLASRLPINAFRSSGLTFVTRDGYPGSSALTTKAHFGYASEGLVRALGLEVLRGRDIRESDKSDSERVAVVTEVLASTLWPGKDPVGRELAQMFPGMTPDSADWHRVVGVVSNIKPILSDSTKPVPFLYRPTSQIPIRGSYPLEVVIDAMDTTNLAERVAGTIASLDSSGSLASISTLTAIADDATRGRRTAVVLLTGCALTAVLLAMIGLYSLVSFSVSQRAREIALRLALGAGRWHLTSLYSRLATTILAVAIAGGSALAYGAMLFANSLFTPAVPIGSVPFFATSVVLAVLIFTSCMIPTWRASRRNVAIVLKE